MVRPTTAAGASAAPVGSRVTRATSGITKGKLSHDDDLFKGLDDFQSNRAARKPGKTLAPSRPLTDMAASLEDARPAAAQPLPDPAAAPVSSPITSFSPPGPQTVKTPGYRRAIDPRAPVTPAALPKGGRVRFQKPASPSRAAPAPPIVSHVHAPASPTPAPKRPVRTTRTPKVTLAAAAEVSGVSDRPSPFLENVSAPPRAQTESDKRQRTADTEQEGTANSVPPAPAKKPRKAATPAPRASKKGKEKEMPPPPPPPLTAAADDPHPPVPPAPKSVLKELCGMFSSTASGSASSASVQVSHEMLKELMAEFAEKNRAAEAFGFKVGENAAGESLVSQFLSSRVWACPGDSSPDAGGSS
jgi:hypothetical protein